MLDGGVISDSGTFLTILHSSFVRYMPDLKDTTYKPVNEIDQETYDLYDPVLFDGAPVCLQLVGRTMQEEQLLAVTVALDKALRHSGVREAIPDEPSEIHCDIA